MTVLRLSVVVPAYRAPHDLARCIAALRSSDLPPPQLDITVVDDGSDDRATTRVAASADHVITLAPPPEGPARARNAGASGTHADIIAFVDADILVHPDALRILLSAFDDPTTAAVFGSYDDEPAAKGVVSQYRNLLHHRVHQRNAGSVESFWAGLGAVRRTVFDSVGGFDEETYTRPEMEDVELGYRMRDGGHRIVLDPRIQGSHLKRWTLGGMLSSDFFRRGVPWARLLASRGMLLSPRGLSLGPGERISAILAVMAIVSLVSALVLGRWHLAALGALFLASFAATNVNLFRWFAAKRGTRFALLTVPLHLLYNLNAIASLVAGAISTLISRPSVQERYRPRR